MRSLTSSPGWTRTSRSPSRAIMQRLSAVKGVGKKTADRIILELHGKISATAILSSEAAPSAGVKASAEDEDAVAALMNLGFTRQESARAVERARRDGAKTIEEVIASALKQM